MPIVQLAELDVERKKCNRIISTFKQVTESYRRNRKLSKEPEPLPKQSDLTTTTTTTANVHQQSTSIDKSKSLINLNQILNSAAATVSVLVSGIFLPKRGQFENTKLQ